jgi:hypothetical protein
VGQHRYNEVVRPVGVLSDDADRHVTRACGDCGQDRSHGLHAK